ncbi:hypothetical protein ACSBR1_028884 [Camellia fascicularis]
MEKLRRLVNQIAYTPISERHSNLSHLQLSLIPLLSFSSSLYKLALFLRYRLYHLGLLRQHRLQVPVISVGNLTWGGNGKTPMVEFIARWDMLAGMKLKCFKGIFSAHLQRLVWGQIELPLLLHFSKELDKLGAAILDDGMQHLSLFRDLEIVMVNGMIPWGNQKLLPLGPLREPLNALCRADVVVVHHADLASDKNLNAIESMLWKLKESLPIFFSRMAPSYFFKAGNTSCKLPLRTVYNMVVLCVSAIGFASAFVQGIEKIGPLHADRLDFSDHHLFQIKDMETISDRLQKLQAMFGSKPIVIFTEKDYDREPEILKHLDPFDVLVLCSELQIVPKKGHTEDSYKILLRQIMESKLIGINKS